MGLFDQVMGFVANSNQSGGLGQLGDIINTVESVRNNAGVDSSQFQTILSVVGGGIQSSLRDTQNEEGNAAAQDLVNNFAGTSPSSAAVNALLTPEIQQQIAETAAERAGLDPQIIQQLLPSVVPLVLNFLQSGGNPIFSAFLDADGDGDVDITDAIALVSKYLGR